MTPEKGHRKLIQLCNKRDFAEAVRFGTKLLRDHPHQPAFWHLVGCAQVEMGSLEAAEQSFTKLIALDGDNVTAHFNLGYVHQKQGRAEAAAQCFARAIALNPNHPQALNNLGNALRSLGRLRESADALHEAIRLQPNYLDAYINLISTLSNLGAYAEALSISRQIAAQRPDDAPNRALLLRLQGQVCDFTAFHDFPAQAETFGIVSAVPPFTALRLEDHPARQLQRSWKWAEASFGTISPATIAHQAQEKPRIGYFSRHLQNHPTLFLTAGLFRAHDTKRFHISVYDLAPPMADTMKERLKAQVSAFHTVHDHSDAEIAQHAREDQLDIAIDLDGHIRDARMGIFAHRAAPIQISFLGYPGSSGASFMDYLIADKTVIPSDVRAHYDERILFMPNSYQPTDNARNAAAAPTKRAEVGLPEEAFVFCCFNNSAKIGTTEFTIWMRVMARVPQSVLWLLDGDRMMRENLVQVAHAHGVSSDRLIFAPRVPQAEHMERLRHADLVVDTFFYNAHTTACDALWVGVPVLTKAGRQFAARVAASLLKSVGLPELITSTDGDYEVRMEELATTPTRMSRLKAHLAEDRAKLPLFDTERYARDLEGGFLAILDRHTKGLPPTDIYLG